MTVKFRVERLSHFEEAVTAYILNGGTLPRPRHSADCIFGYLALEQAMDDLRMTDEQAQRANAMEKVLTEVDATEFISVIPSTWPSGPAADRQRISSGGAGALAAQLSYHGS